VKRAMEVLDKIAALDGVRAVVLVSGDGFPLESVIKDDALNAEEVAALARDGAAAARDRSLNLPASLRNRRTVIPHGSALSSMTSGRQVFRPR